MRDTIFNVWPHAKTHTVARTMTLAEIAAAQNDVLSATERDTKQRSKSDTAVTFVRECWAPSSNCKNKSQFTAHSGLYVYDIDEGELNVDAVLESCENHPNIILWGLSCSGDGAFVIMRGPHAVDVNEHKRNWKHGITLLPDGVVAHNDADQSNVTRLRYFGAGQMRTNWQAVPFSVSAPLTDTLNDLQKRQNELSPPMSWESLSVYLRAIFAANPDVEAMKTIIPALALHAYNRGEPCETALEVFAQCSGRNDPEYLAEKLRRMRTFYKPQQDGDVTIASIISAARALDGFDVPREPDAILDTKLPHKVGGTLRDYVYIEDEKSFVHTPSTHIVLRQQDVILRRLMAEHGVNTKTEMERRMIAAFDGVDGCYGAVDYDPGQSESFVRDGLRRYNTFRDWRPQYELMQPTADALTRMQNEISLVTGRTGYQGAPALPDGENQYRHFLGFWYLILCRPETLPGRGIMMIGDPDNGKSSIFYPAQTILDGQYNPLDKISEEFSGQNIGGFKWVHIDDKEPAPSSWRFIRTWITAPTLSLMWKNARFAKIVRNTIGISVCTNHPRKIPSDVISDGRWKVLECPLPSHYLTQQEFRERAEWLMSDEAAAAFYHLVKQFGSTHSEFCEPGRGPSTEAADELANYDDATLDIVKTAREFAEQHEYSYLNINATDGVYLGADDVWYFLPSVIAARYLERNPNHRESRAHLADRIRSAITQRGGTFVIGSDKRKRRIRHRPTNTEQAVVDSLVVRWSEWDAY